MNALETGLRYAAFGAGIGALFGVASSYLRSRNADASAHGPDAVIDAPNARHDPLLYDALLDLHPYRVASPETYDAIVRQMDRIVSVQMLVASGSVRASYPAKVARYSHEIRALLRKLKQEAFSRMSDSPALLQQFVDRQTALVKFCDNYSHNTTMDVQCGLHSGK